MITSPPPDPDFDWTGSVFVFTDSEKHIAGACRGRDAEGITWVCYGGQRAVGEGVLHPDALGQYQPVVGVG